MGLLIVVAALVGAAFALVWSRRPGGAPALGLGVVAVIAAALVLLSSVRVIPAGHVGVVDLFGRVSSAALGPGVRLVNPLARVERMSVMTQELKETMDVPSREGLTMQVETSVLYHLDPERAPEVYKTLGRGYASILLEPQFRSALRGVTASYDAKALYTSSREEVARRIADDLRAQVGPRGIVIEGTPLRRLVLPQRLAAAIEEKLGAEQESQRMQFVLEKEKQEAERKRIEAQGVSDFQRIVSQGISPELLRWKGIEATLKVAESPNAKVVVIGAGRDGLPIILGGVQ